MPLSKTSLKILCENPKISEDNLIVFAVILKQQSGYRERISKKMKYSINGESILLQSFCLHLVYLTSNGNCCQFFCAMVKYLTFPNFFSMEFCHNQYTDCYSLNDTSLLVVTYCQKSAKKNKQIIIVVLRVFLDLKNKNVEKLICCN